MSSSPATNQPLGFFQTVHPAGYRHEFLIHRVRALCQWSAIAMVVSLLVGLGSGTWVASVLQAIGALCCVGAVVLLRAGRVQLAIMGVIGSLAFVFSGLVWLNHGLADPALMAFAGLLLFAAMLGLRRSAFLLLAFMLVLQIVLVGWANLQGWYVHEPRPLTVSRVVSHALVLTVIGLVAWWLSRDLYRAMDQADAETERVKQGAERMQFMSLHDPLTGLPNRALARLRFEQAAQDAERSGRQLALMVLDLDHFKVVNDSLGHPVGDALLQAVAQRLQALLRSADTLSRFGGDEFLILLTGLEEGAHASRVAAEVVQALSDPFELGGVSVNCGGSVGVALFPADARAFDELVKRADMAMYRAKESGRNGFQFFDDSLHKAVQQQLGLDADMRQALAQGDQFFLAYQPQFHLATGACVGVEALIRWRHPTRGLVSPAQFIPQAERSGFIVPLGAWVLDAACQQASAWRDQGVNLRISVNVSSLQIKRGGFAQQFDAKLAAYRLPPSAIELELTESLLVDDSSDTARALNALVDQGVQLAIDDFGTGYSNLGYLRRFQIGRLKIDRSFVAPLDGEHPDEAIVKAIVQMASSLGMDTLAEGIETEEQRQRLMRLGCQHAQGFLWHPALEPGACAALYRSQQALPERNQA